MTINTSAGRINASESALNLIAIYAAEAAERYEPDGCASLMKEADCIARELHAALYDIGYYDF